MQSGRAGGVRTRELLDSHRLARLDAGKRPRRAAEVDGTVRQPGEGGEAPLQVARSAFDDPVRVGRERFRVHRGDEDRLRHGAGRRGAPEGARAERRPVPGVHQQRLHVLAGECARVPSRVAGEADARAARSRLVGRIHPHDDRDQRPLGAAVHRRHGSRGGGGEADARLLAILEQQLPAPHRVARPDVHRRLHAGIVGGADGDRRRRRGVLERLLGRPRDRQAQSPPETVRGHRS